VGGDVGGNVSRRTVLAGAAWSVPVLVLASAAPAVAASGVVTVTFAAALIELRREDVFAALIEIRNDTGADLQSEPATITLTGFPDNGDFTSDFPEGATSMDEATTGAANASVANGLFTGSGPSGGVMTLTGMVSIPAGLSLVIGIYLRRPASHPVTAVYAIAGSFTIGSRGGAVPSATVSLVD